MSLHKPNVPEAGRASRFVRAHSRQQLPQWLVSPLDEYQGSLEVTEAGVPTDYFHNFSDSVNDRIRRREAEFTHRQLPHALAMRLSMPLPAEIPNGATSYFRTLLERVKHQVEAIETSGVPLWVHDALDLMERNVPPEQQESYMQELVDTLGRAISEFESVPEWLQDALAFRDEAMPLNEQAYFTSFADRVRIKLAEAEVDEPISEWMQQALETETNIQSVNSTYFERFNKRVRQRIEDNAITVVPAWLDRTLMTATHPPIPGGAEVYFQTFSTQILQTISEVSHLETEELVDPTTVERLVNTPDRFQELLASYNDLSLPVGQELYFEDFTDRVKARIHARKLDHIPNNSIMRLMSRPPVQWATAACFGLLLGFVWFWKPQATTAPASSDKTPIHAPTSRPQRDSNAVPYAPPIPERTPNTSPKATEKSGTLPVKQDEERKPGPNVPNTTQ
ncbi:MAG TPA: hypothetical protein DIW24_06515 [Bacteroidetes bacterium]|nr:hypothetical protein [Bacteroidota bacterium]